MLPKHIAIIMDGNGRWAKKRFMPRVAGHRAGVSAVRATVEACVAKNIEMLTLFAFSSENWSRPADEVSILMALFISALEREVSRLNEQNVRLMVIGDRTRFDQKLQDLMTAAEQQTQNNTGLKLVIAANYGGRWDIVTATQQIARKVAAGQLQPDNISDATLDAHLSLAGWPDPDLFIRTSGELRISNFFLWQLSYSELYFTDVLWPDFNAAELDKALTFFAGRERRFGNVKAEQT